MLSILIPATISYAKVYYEQDFENGAKDWEFTDCEISTKFAHSGTHSILSAAQGAGCPFAHVELDVPNVDQFVDLIWLYVDGKILSADRVHHINVWTNAPGDWWVGPHIGIKVDNMIVYAINGFPQPGAPVNLDPSTWYRLITETNLKKQTFNCYVQKEDEEEMVKVFEDTSFIKNRGGNLGDKMEGGKSYFRRVGRWDSPGEDIYFDDLVIADEITDLAVKPAGKLTITWGKMKTEY